VRRARSHLAGRLEFGNECDLGMHRGRSLDVIVSADIRNAPWTRLVEPKRYAAASLVVELIDAFCEPELPLPDVYALLAGAIEAVSRAEDPRALLPRFSLRLLDMLGLAPPPDTCVRCGKRLASHAWLDAQAGGLIDESCRERWRDLPELDERDCRNFRGLGARKGGEEPVVLRATPRVASAIEDLLAHHLGRRPKAGVHLADFVST
jgi:recombinational DNA repair protein (RecF pathway)